MNWLQNVLISFAKWVWSSNKIDITTINRNSIEILDAVPVYSSSGRVLVHPRHLIARFKAFKEFFQTCVLFSLFVFSC